MISFQSLGLNESLVNAVTELGFEAPTPIQAEAIPVLLNNHTDLVGLAQTGTGKTAAFGLPLLHLIDPALRHTQALVLAPTRELCLQITQDLIRYSKNLKGVRIVPVYGGASIRDQIRDIKTGATIVVATPGRLMDLMEKRAVDLSAISYVVLDEADEMLNMGFKEDIDQILAGTSPEKKTWLFSATMPKEVKAISKNYMNKPYELSVGQQNTTNANIEHQYFIVSPKDKYQALKRIVDINTEIFGVIFCRTKIETQEIADKLMQDGYNADSLHGDLSQAQRDKVMRSFRTRSIKILVATDVAARGIDVSNVTHVIHMNLPDEIEFYTHRSGRTARAGKKGISMAIVSPREMDKIRQLERRLSVPFTLKQVPSGVEVCEVRLKELLKRVLEVEVKEKEMKPFLPEVMALFADVSKEDVITRFASLEFNRFLEYYQGSLDLNVSADKRSRDRKDRADDFEVRESRHFTGDRLFINVGKMDGLEKGGLINLICRQSNIKGKDIGRIELKGAYSFFEVEKEITPRVISSFEGFDHNGRPVRVEVTDTKSPSGGGGREGGAPYRARERREKHGANPRHSHGKPRRNRY
ncbi:DEAD/DEAH box helicase [Cytophagales bacterium LB-30]|uniref:DEAD/DEAH box helicase n=1 Tax=Shiella aurantiaca TaxID=3058365 RepID=A0ABT8F346_9BACT|nr:DEAD/DEAH box helicase [Shiella aurantiaca]MDN4164878.1 DEAD/DEAH box helicase [Shiella aurantiaca]